MNYNIIPVQTVKATGQFVSSCCSKELPEWRRISVCNTENRCYTLLWYGHVFPRQKYQLYVGQILSVIYRMV